ILFGWRRYVDLQHEAELRADGERRAAVLASSDSATGLYNRKGFADHGDALIARLSGDEFAVAFTLDPSDLPRADLTAEAVLRAITRPFLLDERMIQVGAFAGIAATPAGEVRIPDLLRRADIAMERAKSGRIARPVWFDAGMERALIAQSEIEQGI